MTSTSSKSSSRKVTSKLHLGLYDWSIYVLSTAVHVIPGMGVELRLRLEREMGSAWVRSFDCSDSEHR